MRMEVQQATRAWAAVQSLAYKLLSRPSRTRGQWGEPYGVTVHKKRGVLIIHSFIQAGGIGVDARQLQEQRWVSRLLCDSSIFACLCGCGR
jgi:hypothetical protein